MRFIKVHEAWLGTAVYVNVESITMIGAANDASPVHIDGSNAYISSVGDDHIMVTETPDRVMALIKETGETPCV